MMEHGIPVTEPRTGATSDSEPEPPERGPAFSKAELAQAWAVVSRLQARIVQSTKQGRWNRVKALQHLLTHSHSARILAVERVATNQGRYTPGVDGETWLTPAKQRTAIATLRTRDYRPAPLRRIYILKNNGKLRPLGIPTMKDRAMQALYLLALDPVAETLADRHSYGFRSARSCADAIQQCFLRLATRHAPEWVLEGDIEACFDRINHNWLLGHVPLDSSIVRKWLKAGYLERWVFHPTAEGTPQGGIISPVLANLALDGLEALLAGAFPKGTRRGQAAKVNLVRYADDFVITGSSRELLETQVKPLVEEFLRERGLNLSAAKTVITHIKDGFDFLGQNIRKYGEQLGGKGKLLITPSRKNVRTFLDKLRRVIQENPQVTTAHLIWLLNSKISGWANYHRHVVSKETFGQVDHALFKMLWHWAVRRHPNKGLRWVKARYFTRVGGNHWVFFGTEVIRGEGRQVTLCRASHTRIMRHVKVRSDLNPYAPEWSDYLARRNSDVSQRMTPARGGKGLAPATVALWNQRYARSLQYDPGSALARP